ncbi:MAG: hypothetical protein RLZZ387_3163 [Chloroflexota bacterium]
MRLQFLGGASGVGATCQLIEVGGRHILVDAGVRMGGVDRLPDLAGLDGVDLAAILVTHAHADHIGALPLVASRYPATPIYASPATIALVEVMLGDAVRVMARRASEELELPLYDDVLVAATLRQLRPLQAGAQALPELPGVAVHAHRAGHIAGAVSIGLEAGDGRLVISGDVSATPQRTILGAALPAPKHPDLLVLESTYGARLHPNRAQEERKLAEAVAQVVVRGGHCLIPAFALGRAQEVILILRAAQRDGLIPEFPIAVDGLVRSVCAAYAAIPAALTPALRRHIEGGRKPFFSRTVQAVTTTQERERVVAGAPGAIIASSGMLTGGPSVWYAERLAANPQSAIFFSGYLDEEAPGRALLDLADAPPETRRITLGAKTFPVACQVGRYGLSAHADGDELAGIVRALQPRAVALVHGDPEARAALRERLRGLSEVLLPQDGQTLAIAPSERGGRRVSVPAPAVSPAPVGIGGGAALDAVGLERLWAALRDGSGVQALGVRELARAWHGDGFGEAEEERVSALLEAGTPFFKPLPGAPGLYRILAPAEARRAQAAGAGAQPRGPRIDQVGIQAIIDRHLGGAPDLYQRSIDPATGAVTLRYFFPDLARERDAAAIARLAEEAGVPVAVSPQPHQGELTAEALACLPAGVTPERTPAIRLESKVVEVRAAGQAERGEVEAAQARFAARTGWRLVITGLALPAGKVAEERGRAPGDEPGLFAPPAGTQRSEPNWAIQTARSWFGEAGCYKAGVDSQAGVLTLRFHFPDAAREREVAHLAELAAYTGWCVRVAPEAHQEALIQAALRGIPAGLTPLGRPALQSAAREVVLRVQGQAAPEEVAVAQDAFLALTGWRLVLRAAP